MFLYIILDQFGNIIFSNDEKKEINNFNQENSKIRIYEKKDFFGEIKIISDLDKHTKSKSTFEKDIYKYLQLYDNIKNHDQIIKSNYEKKIRRIFHNITGLNADNIHILDNILNPSLFSSNLNLYLEEAKKALNINDNSLLINLLMFSKNTQLIKNERIIFDLLENSNPKLNIKKHKLHKVIVNTLYKFYSDFTQKNIIVNLQETDIELEFDYAIFSVILYHIFDNAYKYCLNGTKIKITFNSENNYFTIDFSMISLEVNKDELNSIFDEGYRGSNTSSLENIGGNGIGMYYIKKLSELLNFKIDFTPGTLHKRNNGVDYTDNVISITIPIK